MDRRSFLALSAAAIFQPSSAFAEADALQTLLNEVGNDPGLVEKSWLFREPTVSRGVGKGTPSTRKLSKSSMDLIVTFEVASPAAYRARYRRPIWPKGSSGVTIGVGYDLRFANRNFVERDWPGLPKHDRELLYTVCGLGGKAAKNALPTVKSVDVPWDIALEQFQNFIPYPTKDTEDVYPNCAKLRDDSFGALVSLIYNRGSEMSPNSKRRREMYEIKQLMAQQQFDKIPGRIRAMKRLWQEDPDAQGLLKRREAEALLFEKGLRSG